MKKQIYFILILLLIFCSGYSQQIAKSDTDSYSGKIHIIEFNYGQMVPLADLNDRFGRFNTIGSSVGILFKNNIELGLKGSIFYGRNVKEDVFQNLRNDQGIITGADGIDALLFLRMRGAHIGLQASKILPRNKDTRSGIKIGLGAGILWHKIRLQDDSRSVAQLLQDYQYGYDRLSVGFAVNQFVGYQILAKNQTLNFIFGFDIVESFTKNIRPYNFSGTEEFHNSTRLDVGIGIKVGFMMTFYQFDTPEEIFY